MALRLAGEEYSVVQGLDSRGWLRSIEANDALPGLDIAQNGAGPGLRIKGRVTAPSGRLMLGNPGASGHSLGLEDVHVGGALEVDGMAWLDGGVTLGGDIIGNGKQITGLGGLTLISGARILSTAENATLEIYGGTDYNSGGFSFYGKSHGSSPGKVLLYTPNAALAAIGRLSVTGGADTSVATWSATKVTGQMAVVEHHTALDTLTKEESGSIHTNLGAAGAFALTLPQDARAGDHFYFVVMAAQELRIDPGAAGAIYINGAKQVDDKYIWADDEAESVELVCDGNGDWVAIGAVGTWGVEP